MITLNQSFSTMECDSSSAAETTAVAEPKVVAAPTVHSSRSSSKRPSRSVSARVLARLSCAFNKALTIAGIATVPLAMSADRREHSDACAAEGNWFFEHLFDGSK